MRSLRTLRNLRSLKAPTKTPHQRRQQHTEPPHKYYFQGPGFVPPPLRPSFQPGPSVPTRLLRSALWATLFCALGGAAANAFTTWTWLHTTLKPDSEGDKLYMSLINSRLDDEPLTKLLEEDPEWKLLTETVPDALDISLRGSRGVNARHWINYEKGGFLALIHFGEGVENWPQLVHNGILASFLHNAMEVFSVYCFPTPKPRGAYTGEEFRDLWSEGYFRVTNFEVAFEKPVQSGDVYCLWVTPAYVVGESILKNTTSTDDTALPNVAPEDFQRTMVGAILHIDHFPYDAIPGGRPFVRYVNAVGTLGNLVLPEVKQPVQLTFDGKLV